MDKQAWFKDATVVSSPTPREKKTKKTTAAATLNVKHGSFPWPPRALASHLAAAAQAASCLALFTAALLKSRVWETR